MRIVFPVLLFGLLTGCSSLKRGALVGVGTGAGAAGGYALSRGKSKETQLAYTAGGAVAGGFLTAVGLGKDQKTLDEGYNQGYQQAQSDSIKREYWLRQERERGGEGRLSYYSLPAPDPLPGEARRVPHHMVVPVAE